ncbi:MAG: hypothetical protein AAF431_00390 [Pseudomonadota bacterium]
MLNAKQSIPLAHGIGVAHLRSITGLEEQALEAINSLSAIDLLDRLLLDSSLADVKPGQAKSLPISERDKLLAAVFIDLFGSDIENTVDCQQCAEQFELNFSLAAVQQNLAQTEAEGVKKFGDRLNRNGSAHYVYTLDDGREIEFRLPTGEDEISFLHQLSHSSVAEPNAVNLLTQCVLSDLHAGDEEFVESVLEHIAPNLDIELDAECPECAHAHKFMFNLQDYLLRKLHNDRPGLQREIHALAINYGWSLEQILSLTRHDRTSLFTMTQSELGSA